MDKNKENLILVLVKEYEPTIKSLAREFGSIEKCNVESYALECAWKCLENHKSELASLKTLFTNYLKNMLGDEVRQQNRNKRIPKKEVVSYDAVAFTYIKNEVEDLEDEVYKAEFLANLSLNESERRYIEFIFANKTHQTDIDAKRECRLNNSQLYKVKESLKKYLDK